MSVSAHVCWVAECDVCREPLRDVESEAVVHFGDKATAEQEAANQGWLVLRGSSSLRLLCPTVDAAHRTAIDDLMPPEPVEQVPGQIAIDGLEEQP